MPKPDSVIPEAGQTLVDVTNGKLLRLLVDDEPFECGTATCSSMNGFWTCGPAH